MCDKNYRIILLLYVVFQFICCGWIVYEGLFLYYVLFMSFYKNTQRFDSGNIHLLMWRIFLYLR